MEERAVELIEGKFEVGAWCVEAGLEELGVWVAYNTAIKMTPIKGVSVLGWERWESGNV